MPTKKFDEAGYYLKLSLAPKIKKLKDRKKQIENNINTVRNPEKYSFTFTGSIGGLEKELSDIDNKLSKLLEQYEKVKNIELYR